MEKIVIALGGNALIKPGQEGSFKQQLKNIDDAMFNVAKLILKGYRVVITHGNGPQVGNILLQQDCRGPIPMPLHVCVAESQGMIGYLIQESLYNKLHGKKDIPVVTILTQVLVDRKDPAFRKPTKPVGPYYRFRKKGWYMVKTEKGWRRVVASPKPKRIIEEKEIRKIVGKAVVISCGGGGIPVIRKRGLKGVDAVIDKDLTAAELAWVVDAKTLLILTDVEGIYLDYNTPKQKLLGRLKLADARKLLRKLPEGSMGPKVEAAVNFLDSGGKRVIIARLDKMDEALKGRSGTEILRE